MSFGHTSNNILWVFAYSLSFFSLRTEHLLFSSLTLSIFPFASYAYCHPCFIKFSLLSFFFQQINQWHFKSFSFFLSLSLFNSPIDLFTLQLFWENQRTLKFFLIFPYIHLMQGSKGIRQWLINLCTSPMIINKIIPSLDYHYWLTL